MHCVKLNHVLPSTLPMVLWPTLQVAFVEQPQKVDFEVTVMGGSTLSGLIPSLKAWLVGFARDSLISMYVMPEHWTYRIDPVSLVLTWGRRG